ncbi:MAG TPA: YbhB/YbcL family Raf kinase inhibitor-like protein [Egibacteraceae bacterium]|nr:YbhB/YbcL family Raf kinase inhibitor-like protein [Egibacteraceae bacterium]
MSARAADVSAFSEERNMAGLRIWSPAFEHAGPIDTRHARDGDDISPPLEWSGVPDGALQLALVCHDPDAPTSVHGFTHWVVYGIPPSATGIPEGGGGQFVEGRNDYGEIGWGGPQPPVGHGHHHYYFWLYALDTELGDGPGLTRAQLLDRIEKHAIDLNRVVGTYER